MSLEFGLATTDLSMNMGGNVWKIGFNLKINKATATLISGCRLFFWLKIRCFKGIQELCFAYRENNIYQSYIFQGFARGGESYTFVSQEKYI